MLSDRIVPALASVGLGCALLFTAGFAREVGISAPDIPPPRAPRVSTPFAPGELVARLTVPRLSLDSPVFEGLETETLVRGAGHLPGTSLPGEEEAGYPSVIALSRGHRGAAVAGLRLGDVVRVTTTFGPRRYRVAERRVMEPTNFRLKAAPAARVTLLAPFPANSPGPAPMRVAVELERLAD